MRSRRFAGSGTDTPPLAEFIRSSQTTRGAVQALKADRRDVEPCPRSQRLALQTLQRPATQVERGVRDELGAVDVQQGQMITVVDEITSQERDIPTRHMPIT